MIDTGRWKHWLYVGPALLLVGFFLVYPTVATIVRSFFGRGQSLFGPNVEFVGLTNWRYVFTNDVMLASLRNNALWAVLFTTCTVGFGLVLAVLLDRVKYEKIIKSAIFIPAAISGVGVAVIWKFIYEKDIERIS